MHKIYLPHNQMYVKQAHVLHTLGCVIHLRVDTMIQEWLQSVGRMFSQRVW